jgi:hypothetical protein
MDARLSDALDRLDPRRFDTEEILRKLNEFNQLSDEEQDTELNIWEYSGLSDAAHPLTDFLQECHNAISIARDLDGSLVFFCEEDIRTGLWESGPLCVEHLNGPFDDEVETAEEVERLRDLDEVTRQCDFDLDDSSRRGLP